MGKVYVYCIVKERKYGNPRKFLEVNKIKWKRVNDERM
jgi:hypothetical protein